MEYEAAKVYPQPVEFQATVQPMLGAFFYNSLIQSIDNCKTDIKAIQYQWKWNIHQRHSKVQQLGASIIRARQRNTHVRIILNKEGPNRHITKINQVTGDQLNRAGCLVKLLKTPSLLHTKLWIIDHELVFIGSHNISTRSLTLNEEATVLINCKGMAKFMTIYFEQLWGQR